jgi:hypothetical protein
MADTSLDSALSWLLGTPQYVLHTRLPSEIAVLSEINTEEIQYNKSHSSTVGIATGCGLDV